MNIKPNQKEIARADTDGLTIVVRPSSGGGYSIFLIDINAETEDGCPNNSNVYWAYHADHKYEIRKQVAESLRMANKCAIGESMPRKSRVRNFYSDRKWLGWI
jgi:hypothetical protein